MDPLTQAVVGAALPAAKVDKKRVRLALLTGALGGMAPDLDIFIRSQVDPLMAFEYHRHFTHSLFFIPLVGLVVAFALWALFNREKKDFKFYYIFTTLGVATHGLLDTCTGYGTYLLWPLSDVRYSFNNMSIIDPIFTIPLLLLVVLSAILRSSKISMVALVYGFAYIGFSTHQRNSVEDIVMNIATERGHNVEHMYLNPTLGNNVLWRAVYESDGRYYVNAVRYTPFSTPQVRVGESVAKVNAENIYPEFGENSQQRKDILRFNHFASGLLYEVAPYKLGDLRYSALPYSTEPMWGITLNPENPEEHVRIFRATGDREVQLQELKKLVLQTDVLEAKKAL